MAKQCWENCPKIQGYFDVAYGTTEYMPPGGPTDEVYRRAGNLSESLSNNCPGPRVKIIEVDQNLPFQSLRRILHLSETKKVKKTVYDCAKEPVYTSENI